MNLNDDIERREKEIEDAINEHHKNKKNEDGEIMTDREEYNQMTDAIEAQRTEEIRVREILRIHAKLVYETYKDIGFRTSYKKGFEEYLKDIGTIIESEQRLEYAEHDPH